MRRGYHRLTGLKLADVEVDGGRSPCLEVLCSPCVSSLPARSGLVVGDRLGNLGASTVSAGLLGLQTFWMVLSDANGVCCWCVVRALFRGALVSVALGPGAWVLRSLAAALLVVAALQSISSRTHTPWVSSPGAGGTCSGCGTAPPA